MNNVFGMQEFEPCSCGSKSVRVGDQHNEYITKLPQEMLCGVFRKPFVFFKIGGEIASFAVLKNHVNVLASLK